MRALLISTYDLGRQPLGLASPAAWLREAGVEVRCVDTSREPLLDEDISAAGLVGFFLPMHTATRLAVPLVARVRTVNPTATMAAYGLYAPLNAPWLREQGVDHVLGPDDHDALVALVNSQLPTANSQPPTPNSQEQAGSARGRRRFVQPDRSTLLPLARYAALKMPDGTRRVVGSTDATRGCKHLCRHCPIVPVYQGVFRAVPLDGVLEDIRAQVAQGAEHISFGDPDFLNGPTHSRRLVERLSTEFPQLTYDVTIKIEHLLAHAGMLDLLHDTGCLFITSAVESVDDKVLGKLRKGHTRADFVWAVDLCRRAGVALSPTFVPFTPWTTLEGYADLLNQIDALGLVNDVAPIQLAIRLLVTAESALLELPDIRAGVDVFDPQSLTWPWRHIDPRVDALHRDIISIVRAHASGPRGETFAAISSCIDRARDFADEGQGAATAVRRGLTPRLQPPLKGCCPADGVDQGRIPPHLTEAWYCCAEPGDELGI